MEQRNTLKELQRLQEENRKLRAEAKENVFGAAFLKNNDKRTSFYTGVPNFRAFMWLVSFLQHSLPAFSSVQVDDVLLIVLMKLKLNLHNYDIATRFKVSKTTVSDILDRSIPVIADKLKFLIHWPEKEDTRRNLPRVFKPKYKNV